MPRGARARCVALLGDAPRRRDLLIELLHLIQDRFGCLAGRASRRARRRDEDGDGRGVRSGDLLSPLRRGEGRRHGSAARSPFASAIRSPASWPARSDLLESAAGARSATDVRVLHAPCVGRCETAPVAVVGQNPVPHATSKKVVALVAAGRRQRTPTSNARGHARATSTTRRTARPAGTRSRRRASAASERPRTSSR